jgi:Tfp pilus assembly protein PilV
VKLDKQGLTLVEVLIALVVALLVFFALMQTALLGIDANVRNLLRNEAVSIAEMRMNFMRNVPYDSIVSDTTFPGGYACPTTGFSTGVPIERDFRNISSFDFCSNLICRELGGDGNCMTNDATIKQIIITIGWKWKGEDLYHRITTVRNKR